MCEIHKANGKGHPDSGTPTFGLTSLALANSSSLDQGQQVRALYGTSFLILVKMQCASDSVTTQLLIGFL